MKQVPKWWKDVLSTVIKLLERCIHNQLYSYLTTESLLTDQQSGFGKGHSTTTCLVDFLDNIYQEVDEGVPLGALFGSVKGFKHCCS